MAFCTNCGGALADGARFCTNCGTPVAAAAGAPVPAPAAAPVAAPAPMPPPPPPAPVKLEYAVQGGNLQIARVRLKPGQELYAEAGKMIYKTANVAWQTRMSGESLGEKIWGAVKRRLMGESLFLTYFQAMSGDGEVGFAGSYPGKIQVFELGPGQSVLVQRDSFLFAESSVNLDIALVKRLGAGFFGGEGFILERLTGPGTVFIHAGGDFVEFTLGPGEVLQVDTGCIVAFDTTIDYDIELVGSIKTALFGGEGLFVATLRGPGRVIIQSMTLEKMRRDLAAGQTGGDQHKGIDALSGIFDAIDT
ncbi:MAG TPA: TIGR00266 family protein [Bryobacteraceae bacterium]|nr:TIGR00266 family protein [Bryobacteraceae bacterium]